jgi:hypothetical protein
VVSAGSRYSASSIAAVPDAAPASEARRRIGSSSRSSNAYRSTSLTDPPDSAAACSHPASRLVAFSPKNPPSLESLVA